MLLRRPHLFCRPRGCEPARLVAFLLRDCGSFGNLDIHSFISIHWLYRFALCSTVTALQSPALRAHYLHSTSPTARVSSPPASHTIALFDLSQSWDIPFNRQHGPGRANLCNELFVSLEPTTLFSTPISTTYESGIDCSSRPL